MREKAKPVRYGSERNYLDATDDDGWVGKKRMFSERKSLWSQPAVCRARRVEHDLE